MTSRLPGGGATPPGLLGELGSTMNSIQPSPDTLTDLSLAQ